MNWLKAVLDALVRLLVWWKSTEDAATKAETEMAAEIAHEDRKRANEIRDRIDAGRLGGGLHSDRPDDQRGYRD